MTHDVHPSPVDLQMANQLHQLVTGYERAGLSYGLILSHPQGFKLGLDHHPENAGESFFEKRPASTTWVPDGQLCGLRGAGAHDRSRRTDSRRKQTHCLYYLDTV